MSHFNVAVILKDINDLEKVLAPYQENCDGDCPKKYLKFYSVLEECKKDYEKEKEATKINYPTLKDYIEKYCLYEYDESQKDYGYWENPNAKWDYWQLCELGSLARYQNKKIPSGFCKIKDFGKKINQKIYKELLRFWEIVVEEQPLKESEEKPLNYYKKEYYFKRYGTKENFARINATPHTFAFVYNGEWYEKVSVHWFGIDDSTKDSEELYLEKFKQIINEPSNQDLYIAIVDCHI